MSDDIRLELSDAARLRAALESGDPHLSDEDFVNRAFDDGTPEDTARIDAHVSACPDCRQELERTRALARDMNSEERRPQIDRLWKGFVAAGGGNRLLRDFAAMLRTIVLPIPRLATRGPLPTRGAQGPRTTAAGAIAEGSSPDGRLTWRFTDRPLGGGLHGLIVSAAVEPLRGASVWLNTDPPRGVTLVEASGELRAEFVLTLEEWRRTPRGPLIQKVVTADGEIITSND